MDPPPEFIAERLALWDRLKKEYDEFVAKQENVAIKITLPDGKQVDGLAWKTTPYEVARGIRYMSNNKINSTVSLAVMTKKRNS